MWKRFLGSKKSWITLLYMIIFGLIMVGLSFIINYYEKYYICAYLGFVVIVILLFYSYKRKRDINNTSSDDKAFDDNYTYISNDIDDDDRAEIGKSLILFGIIFIISLIFMIIIMINKGFNFDYFFNYIVGMAILLEFVVMPNTKKMNELKGFLFQTFDVILYTVIILGILWLLNKFVFKII